MAVIEATWLRPLADHVDDDDAAISVYVDLSPAAAPTPGDLASHVRSVHDTLGQAGAGRSPAARKRLQAGASRVAEFLEREDLRGGGEVHGAAVFALAGDVFTAAPLWRSAGELTTAGRRLVLRPAAALASRTNDVLLVEAGRELGRVIAFDHGRMIDVADADEHIANRHSQGGWMQSRIQRDVDRQAELHLGDVVAIVERLHDALGRPPIVIAATDEHAAVVRERMSEPVAAAVTGVLGNARDMGAARLHEELRRLADEHDQERERALLDRRAEQLGREEVAGGLEGVLDAAYTGRAETLLVARGADPDVFACPECGRLGAEARVCPYDETFMQHEPDGIEAVVSATLRADGTVWELMDPDRRDLDAAAGLGAIVRY